MKKQALLFGMLLTLFISCSKKDMYPQILIRISNQVETKLTDISVFSSITEGGQVEKWYGTVQAGSLSHYIGHQKMLSMPLLRYTIPGSGIYECRNIRCGMGLTNLEPGKYSLVIRGQSSSPDILFIKD